MRPSAMSKNDEPEDLLPTFRGEDWSLGAWLALIRDRYLTLDRRTLGFTRILLGFLLLTDLFHRHAAWNEMFRSLLAYDDTAELSRIDVPVSLVWGDADPLVSRSMQDRLLRLLPTAELSVLRGVRHTPRWEVPEGFARTVDELADRVLVPD